MPKNPTYDYGMDARRPKLSGDVGIGLKQNLHNASLDEFSSALDSMAKEVRTVADGIRKSIHKGGSLKQQLADAEKTFGPNSAFADALRKAIGRITKDWGGKNSIDKQTLEIIGKLKNHLDWFKNQKEGKGVSAAQYLSQHPEMQKRMLDLFAKGVTTSNAFVGYYNDPKLKKGAELNKASLPPELLKWWVDMKTAYNTHGTLRDKAFSTREKWYDRSENKMHHIMPQPSDDFKIAVENWSKGKKEQIMASVINMINQKSMVPLLPPGSFIPAPPPQGSTYEEKNDYTQDLLKEFAMRDTIMDMTKVPNVNLPIPDNAVLQPFTEEADYLLEKTNRILADTDKLIEESTKTNKELIEEVVNVCNELNLSTKWVNMLAKDLGTIGETLGVIGSALDAKRELSAVLPEGASLFDLLSPKSYGVGKSEWGKGFLNNLKDVDLGRVLTQTINPKTGRKGYTTQFSIMKYLNDGVENKGLFGTMWSMAKSPLKTLGKMGGLAKAGVGATWGLSASSAIPIIGAIAVGVGQITKMLAKSSPVLKGVLDIFKTAYDLFFMPIGNALGMLLLPLATGLIDWVLAWIDLWNDFSWGKFWQLMLDTLKGIARLIVDLFFGLIEGALNLIIDLPEILLGLIFTLVKEIFRWFGLDAGVLDEILTKIRDFTDGIKGALHKVFDAIKEFFHDPVRYIAKAIMAVFSGVGDFFEGLGQGAKNLLNLFKGIGKDPLQPIEMATGGIVTSAIPAIVGEAGPEAVIPLDRLDGIGTTININIGTVYGMNDFERKVEDIMNNQMNRGRYR